MSAAASRVAGPAAAGAALVAGAVAAGAACVLAAYAVHPLAFPALVVGLAVAAVSAGRPEVGVAAVLVLQALATLGVLSDQAALLSTAFALYLLVVTLVVGERVRTWPVVGLPALLSLLAAFVGFAVHPSAYGQELVRSIVTGVALFFVVALVVRERRQAAWVLGAAVACAVLVGANATLQSLAGRGLESGFVTSGGSLVGRVSAGFSQPNQLGGYLAVLVPLVLGAVAVLQRGRALAAVAVALAIGGIYGSFSRSALVTVAVVPVLFLGLRRTLLLVPPLLVLALATPDLLEERFATLTSSGSEVATRADFWRTAGAVWSERPVLGAGLGRFPEAYASARVPGKQFLPMTSFEPPPHAHNVELHLLAEQGIVGLAAFVLLMGSAAAAAVRLRGAAERWVRVCALAGLAAVTAFLLHNQFDVTLFQSQTGAWLWVVLGLIAALATRARHAQGAR